MNWRKTLAGVCIARTVGFSLRRVSERVKARRKVAPVAKQAERMVCNGLGIVQDGEEITEQAMEEFARRFKGKVHEDVLGAMRALFKLDSVKDEEMVDGLIGIGGAAALDHEQDSGSNTANV
jgi:DNA polymerase elongation subunit (family B)